MRKAEKSSLLIGIDIRPYLIDKSGMGQYVYQLTKHLLAVDTKNKYILFSDREFELPDIKKNFQKVIFSLPVNIGIVNTTYFHLMTLLFAKKKCTLYLTTSALYIPAILKNFAIIVVHDLTIFKYPKYHKLKTRILITPIMKYAIYNSKAVIAVSNNTRKDIINMFPKVNPPKIHTIYLGANLELAEYIKEYDENFWKELSLKFFIKKPYILFMGSTEPRKNILSLVKAFELIAKDDQNIYLVIAGKRGWGIKEINEYINEIKYEDIKKRIILTGFISDKEKAYLYKNALMLVYPSFYEGFGIPLLEAMIFNIPFVTSNTSSLPEITGEAGILVSPGNISEIKDGILKLIREKKLKNDLIKKEQNRLKIFSWNNAALKVIELYNTK